MNPRAYGSFIKKTSHISRTSAYIQWGTSEASIGSCLLLNPGSADFQIISPDLAIELNRKGHAQGVVRTDPTMDRLIALVDRIYSPTQLNGRFHIYNLFTIQNTKATNAIDEFKRLVQSGDYDPLSALVPIKELEEHPWILLGWGCDEDSFPVDLVTVKSQWLSLIGQAGIPSFGKEHPRGKGYYHPCPLIPTKRPGMIDDLSALYETVIGNQQSTNSPQSIQIFSVNDAKSRPVVKGDSFDLPEVEWRGWTIMKDNPEDIVKGFSHLQLDQRYKLRAYQFIGGAGANGVVWAIPQDRELPHPAECEILDDGWSTPKPRFALDDFMEAISGDNTPISYLQAAVLVHEVMEFGAEWHGVSWGTHRMLSFDDSTDPDTVSHYSSEWTMEIVEPEVWEPHFYYSTNGEPTVIFHTVDCVAPMTINRFIHTFSTTNYSMRIERQVVAYGTGGIIF